MTASVWPVPTDAVSKFYSTQLALPLDLWRAFQVTSPGSRRPAGPRRLQWVATVVLAVSALEAGLEELIVAAHGARAGRTGAATLGRQQRKFLVEDPLQAPSGQKIEQVLFSSFGLELDVLPATAQFEARVKNSPNGGSGRGERAPSPSNWSELKKILDAVIHVRHATAHGDVRKQSNLPPYRNGEGLVWVETAAGAWTVQQPHCLTTLRVVTAVYNAVAAGLDAHVGLFGGHSPLRSPNEVAGYER